MKPMKIYFVLSLISAISLSVISCATTTPQSQQTQLQIRQFQTRSFETNNVKMVMKAMLNVLQDDDYIVKNADLELGLLTATKEVDIENTGEAVMAALFGGANARWAKNSIIEITANISEYGEQCRVRVNFQTKKINNKDEVIKVKKITDAEYYQNFFSKVSKGIFIEGEGL